MITHDGLIIGGLFVFLIGLNAFLMWANHEQARTIRRQRRTIQVHVKHEGGTLLDLSKLLGGDR